MNTTRYTLKTITPLFLRGPDGETPELRPPSFKGMLRYWWRALHPMPVDRLREAEAERFGSGGDAEGGQSPIRLRLDHSGLSEDRYKPVPRAGKNFRNRGFKPGEEFDLVVTVGPRALGRQEEIDATLRLMLLLGGVGNRSRRGFGSLRLIAVNGVQREVPEDPLEDVETHLGRLETPFDRDGRTLSYVGKHLPAGQRSRVEQHSHGREHDGQDVPEYPWVRRIETGTFWNGWQEAVQSIAKASHRHDSSYTGDIGPRLSSPVYVSVGADDRWCWPLVTSLHLPSSTERKIGKRESDTRPEFREALL
ncbi:type III-B CRISPR module RAMP protein Cmr1 [Salinibacter sp.]|uniref:type III-B CRISPR module RAMP protein Cmr1 n=1 Tax=Salinibacter sp. TaxID=2065818 RepID=UPI003D6E44C4